jgi:nickel-dependent lactate racemase
MDNGGMRVELGYGRKGRMECELDPQRRFVLHRGPVSRGDLRERLRKSLISPLDFPPLDQTVLPDDRVVMAVDPSAPCVAEMVAEVCLALQGRGLSSGQMVVLQPKPPAGVAAVDPRRLLPEEDQDQMGWICHDSTDDKAHAYLATTARGERIYLARELVEADVVLALGGVGFDSLLGLKGTHSAFYPALSNQETIEKTRGEGHWELEPDDVRPLRQTIDEVAWLLGSLFSVQVVPGAGGGATEVLAGSNESVLRRGRQLLLEYWRVPVPERVDLVIASVENAEGASTWDQVGAALAAAQRIVARGGRIVLLSDLEQPLGPGLEILRSQRSPRTAQGAIRKAAPPDLIPAIQVAGALDWARVFFLGQLPEDLVDDLGMAPLSAPKEAARLLQGDDSCALLGSAHQTWTEISST